jgi:hypothetical protein
MYRESFDPSYSCPLVSKIKKRSNKLQKRLETYQIFKEEWMHFQQSYDNRF